MSVVKINAIAVPDGRGADLEARFAARAREVDGVEGFEGFELLRPVDGETRYFVYTRWRSEEDFQRWVSSRGFRRGHKASDAGTDNRPVGVTSELLSFEVVELAS
ncbi:MAG: antibiotic biosynthesis monooxygenase [Acidimicrobiia bacterium]|nr:antibiotic biosynthesis monooxygenase [Acidimicrobiia bacterium]MYF82622.1 antibiotic biosynthesis monooxygenase [Acidimicrobiia bacterium]